MIKAKIITNNKIKKFLSSNEIIKLDNFYFQQNVKTLFSCNSFTSLPNFSAFLFSSLLQMFRHFLLFILSFLWFSFFTLLLFIALLYRGGKRTKDKKSVRHRQENTFSIYFFSSLRCSHLFCSIHHTEHYSFTEDFSTIN